MSFRTLATAPNHVIETDGRTLWINGPSGLLGRFSPLGIDIHTEGQCVDCKTGTPDFDAFAANLQIVHGIDVLPFRSALGWLYSNPNQKPLE